MESLGPSLWNPILNLLLHLFPVRTLSKSIVDALLVKLIKLIVEFSNHVLDLKCLFFLEESIDYCLLNFFKVIEALVSCVFHFVSDWLLL